MTRNDLTIKITLIAILLLLVLGAILFVVGCNDLAKPLPDDPRVNYIAGTIAAERGQK